MEENENNLTNEMIVSTKNDNKKFGIIFTSIAILFVIVAIALGASGVFKSNGERFFELLTKDQYLVKMIQNRGDDFISDGKRNYKLILKKDFLSIIDSTFSFLGNDLVLNADVINDGDDFDSSASLKLGTLKLQSLELIKEDDVIALSVPNLFENFIAINDENTKEVASKLGFSESVIIEDVDLEALRILNKYSKILIKSINDYIDVSNKVSTDINDKNFITKEYTLSLDEKELNIIALEILGELKDDDEAINLIVKYANENIDNYMSSELTNESLKEEIISLYNDVFENINTITDETSIVLIKINSYNNKAIKTVVNVFLNEETYEFILASIADAEDDYMLIALNMLGSNLELEYNGKKNEEKYNGKVTINADDASITAVDLSIEKIQNSNAKVRRIEELNALLLNEATDEELEALRKEIEKNLGIESDEIVDMVYEEGEFKLENVDAQIKIVEPSRMLYNQLKIGMSKEDAIKIMGEPHSVLEFDSIEYNGWYYEGNENIFFISIELSDGKISAVYNDIASSMENNIQISTELETEIVDLNEAMSEVYLEMRKDEVIKILGEKYLEVGKTNLGYTIIKWYDKNENRVIIEFDNENKASYIDPISMDF